MDKDTSEYSSTKAPETRQEAEEKVSQPDSRLIPGGAEPKTPSQQGMAGLERDDLPGRAINTGQTRYRDTGKSEVTGD
jgi:hypothetical protein